MLFTPFKTANPATSAGAGRTTACNTPVVRSGHGNAVAGELRQLLEGSSCGRRAMCALLLPAAVALPATASQPGTASTVSATTTTSSSSSSTAWLPGLGPSVCSYTANPGQLPNPGVGWALRAADKQLRYPAWLEGTWQVTATFDQVTFPQGQGLLTRSVPGVLKASMVAGLPDVGAAMQGPLQYQARYTSSPQEGGVVADRPFNLQQKMDAFLGYPAVRRVEYNPADNPTRLSLVYGTPRKDTAEIREDLRKAELFINNRGSCSDPAPSSSSEGSGSVAASSTGSSSSSESNSGVPGAGRFTCFELFRQVTQARQQGAVGDYLVLEEWMLSAPQEVHTRQWVLAYLQPQDPAYFKAGNLPVAVYQYSYDFYRR